MSESFRGVNMSLGKRKPATFTLIKESAVDAYGRNKGMNSGYCTESGLGAIHRSEHYTKNKLG